jgi:hypothetical protein
LDSYSQKFFADITENDIIKDPLNATDDAAGPDDVALPTGGCISLIAYWVFSATIFDADQPTPGLNVLPQHFALLEKILEEDPQGQIQQFSGTCESVVAIGLWLHANGRILATPYEPKTNSAEPEDEPPSEFMQYLHLVTLIALYHPRLQVRNAATVLAGQTFHADPSEEDKLRILYDLIENCTFASLKACAITWFREEIIDASKTPPSSSTGTPTTATKTGSGVFSGPHAFDTLQYVIFPDLNHLSELGVDEFFEYFGPNVAFLLQAINFAVFLWSSAKWRNVLPENAEATVQERWFRPLWEAVDRIKVAIKHGADVEGEGMEYLLGEMDVLLERIMRLGKTEEFGAAGEVDQA